MQALDYMQLILAIHPELARLSGELQHLRESPEHGDRPGSVNQVVLRWKEAIATTSLAGLFQPDKGIIETASLPGRFADGLAYLEGPLSNFVLWLTASNETSNFTYDLTEINQEHLAWFVSGMANVEVDRVRGWLRELQTDTILQAHLREQRERSTQRPFMDSAFKFGRRLGWYAVIRAMKPKWVIETGTDKGLGSCVIAAALMRNASENARGRLITVDLHPRAGDFFAGAYAEFGTIVRGDSVAFLRSLDHEVDLFIHDSDHSPEHERNEFAAVESKLSARAVLLSDNSHETLELSRFAERTGRHFEFFREVPDAHPYPGGGIGAAFFR